MGDDDDILNALFNDIENPSDDNEDKSKYRGIDFLAKAIAGQTEKESISDLKKSIISDKNSGDYNLGNSKEQILRLTSRTFINAYDILQLTSEATVAEVKKRYRKLSLLVHPDKNPGETKADEAFHIVSRAFEDAINGEAQSSTSLDKYDLVMAEAKKRVKKKIRALNKIYEVQRKPLLSTKDADIAEDVIEECENMLTDIEEKKSYAMETFNYNMQREAEETLDKEKEEDEMKRKLRDFKEGRVVRTSEWKRFQEGVKSGEIKQQWRKNVGYTKEERTAEDDTVMNSNIKVKRAKTDVGLDESYKANWR